MSTKTDFCCGRDIFFSAPACWSPGITTKADWQLWANGTKQIDCTKDAPKLEFTDALFRRRLSQISKMTIQVVHDALEQTKCGDIKQVFISLRGEIARQFAINKSIIYDRMILPAAFSLSVFNAPIALSSLAFKLKSGYSVITPSQADFASALQAALAIVLGGSEERILLVYADELVPEEYGSLRPAQNEPLAFATVVSAKCFEGSKQFSMEQTLSMTPQKFLKLLLKSHD